jgi:hypothetical protein
VKKKLQIRKNKTSFQLNSQWMFKTKLRLQIKCCQNASDFFTARFTGGPSDSNPLLRLRGSPASSKTPGQPANSLLRNVQKMCTSSFYLDNSRGCFESSNICPKLGLIEWATARFGRLHTSLLFKLK